MAGHSLAGLGAAALAAVSGWKVVEALLAAPHESSVVRPLVYLGLATVLAVTAWGFWRCRVWGTLLAMVWSGLAILSAGSWPAFAGLVVLLVVLSALPHPLRVGLGGEAAARDVDRVAAALGVRWESHPVTRVEELLRAGKAGEAAKAFREEAGVPWDVAHEMVAHWGQYEVERKLQLLARHVSAQAAGRPPEPAGQADIEAGGGHHGT